MSNIVQLLAQHIHLSPWQLLHNAILSICCQFKTALPCKWPYLLTCTSHLVTAFWIPGRMLQCTSTTALLNKGHTTCNNPFKIETICAVRSSDNMQRTVLTTTLTMSKQAQLDSGSSNINHCNQKAGLMQTLLGACFAPSIVMRGILHWQSLSEQK